MEIDSKEHYLILDAQILSVIYWMLAFILERSMKSSFVLFSGFYIAISFCFLFVFLSCCLIFLERKSKPISAQTYLFTARNRWCGSTSCVYNPVDTPSRCWALLVSLLPICIHVFVFFSIFLFVIMLNTCHQSWANRSILAYRSPWFFDKSHASIMINKKPFICYVGRRACLAAVSMIVWDRKIVVNSTVKIRNQSSTCKFIENR